MCIYCCGPLTSWLQHIPRTLGAGHPSPLSAEAFHYRSTARAAWHDEQARWPSFSTAPTDTDNWPATHPRPSTAPPMETPMVRGGGKTITSHWDFVWFCIHVRESWEFWRVYVWCVSRHPLDWFIFHGVFFSFSHRPREFHHLSWAPPPPRERPHCPPQARGVLQAQWVSRRVGLVTLAFFYLLEMKPKTLPCISISFLHKTEYCMVLYVLNFSHDDACCADAY